MKRMVKNLALSALILAIAAPAFSAPKKNKDGTVDIELWYGATQTEAGPIPADWKGFDILKKKLKINLKLTALPSAGTDQDTKINAAAAANALPDLFMVTDNVFANLQAQGVLANVDSMYKKMPGRTKQQYDKASKDFTTFADGHSYGLASPGSVIKNEGVLIRKDWLDKLGLKVPKTTDEFLAVMHAFTEKDPDGNGKADTYGYGCYIESSATNMGLGRRLDPIFGAFGVAGTWNITNKKDSGLNINKPEYFEALSFVKRMCDEKVIDPNWLSLKKEDFRGAWKQGRFGIMREQNGAYGLEANYKPFDDNFPNGEWIVIDPPVGPAGKSSAGTYDTAYRIYCVSKKAADEGKLDLIAKLLEWMSSKEGYYLCGYGVEGVNYVIGKDKIPTMEGLKNPDLGYAKSAAAPYIQLRNMVFYNSDVELLSRYPTWYTKNGKKMSAFTVLRDMQKRSWTANYGAGKMPKPTADLERFYNEGVIQFVNGNKELTKANWEAFVKEFNDLGGKAWNDDGVAIGIAGRYIK